MRRRERPGAVIIQAGDGVLAARQLESDLSLADLYTPSGISPELIDAHRDLDRVVDRLFGITTANPAVLQRQDALFPRYQELTSHLSSSPLATPARRQSRRRT